MTTWWSSSQELRGRFVILAATAQVALRKEGREEAKVVSTECPSRGKTDGATRKSASDRTRAHGSPRFPLARSPAPWGCSARRSLAPSSVQWHCTRMSVRGSHHPSPAGNPYTVVQCDADHLRLFPPGPDRREPLHRRSGPGTLTQSCNAITQCAQQGTRRAHQLPQHPGELVDSHKFFFVLVLEFSREKDSWNGCRSLNH